MTLKSSLVLIALLIVSASVLARPSKEVSRPSYETRCGWFSNPTPANVSLFDRDGEWVIGTQGGYQVEGYWDWPEFDESQWVNTNGHYGYGCACLKVQVNAEAKEIIAIKSARVRPLKACRQDAALKRWQGSFQ